MKYLSKLMAVGCISFVLIWFLIFTPNVPTLIVSLPFLFGIGLVAYLYWKL